MTGKGSVGQNEGKDWIFLADAHFTGENRDNQNSRILQLIFVRVHALDIPTLEPVFLLNGGPGKSNIRGVLSSVFFKHNDLCCVR